MKLAMSRLDIMVCARELKNAIGARVENVYEINGSIWISLRFGGEHPCIVCDMGRRVSLSRRRPKAPKAPSSFAMLLRKHLCGSTLSGVEQPDLERVLALEFSGEEKRALVVELFGRGNIVLCDGSMRIIHPYRSEAWKGRRIAAGEVYVLPPGPRVAPGEISTEELKKLMEGAPDVVRGLAVNLGLGGTLAEEICARSGVGKALSLQSISDEQLAALVDSIKNVFAVDPAPRIVYMEGDFDVVPFEFVIYCGMESRAFPTFNEALDAYFGELEVRTAAERARKKLEAELEKLRRRLAEEQENFAKLYERSIELKRKADLISVKHKFVEVVLDEVRKVLGKIGYGGAMEEIKKAAGSGACWAPAVKGIKSGRVVVEISGEEIALHPGSSAFQNASRYYDEYKKFAEKSIGARRAIERTAAELERLQSEGPAAFQPPGKEERMWFERYRWAISSSGFLILGGRDEKSNSELVRKRMGPRDIYLHAEIRGAPHVIIRSDGRDIPEGDIREAAEFAAMHSRAWAEGIGALKVFWVMANQVSRRAPSGMYIPRGGFMVTGERNYLEVPLRAGVGVIAIGGRELPVCGPLSAIRNRCRVFIEVFPGETKKRDAAKEIREKLARAGFDVSAEDIERALPPGGCRIVTEPPVGKLEK